MSIEIKGWRVGTKEEKAAFTITCDKCGSSNVRISDSTGCGSSWTGCWGSIDIECHDCDNQYEIMSM